MASAQIQLLEQLVVVDYLAVDWVHQLTTPTPQEQEEVSLEAVPILTPQPEVVVFSVVVLPLLLSLLVVFSAVQAQVVDLDNQLRNQHKQILVSVAVVSLDSLLNQIHCSSHNQI